MEIVLGNRPAIISWSYFMNKHTNRVVAKCVLSKFAKATRTGKATRITVPIQQVFIEDKSSSRNIIRKKALTHLLMQSELSKEERRVIWEKYKEMRNGHW